MQRAPVGSSGPTGQAERKAYKAWSTGQGLKDSYVEEIAYRMGYIDADQLEKVAQPLMKNGYGEYLLKIHE